MASESLDVVVDVVGGEAFPRRLDALKRGGRYVVAGAIGGPNVELDLRTLYLRDLRLIGCTILEPDVFTHLVGYIERAGLRDLNEGQKISYEIVADKRSGKSSADNLKAV